MQEIWFRKIESEIFIYFFLSTKNIKIRKSLKQRKLNY